MVIINHFVCAAICAKALKKKKEKKVVIIFFEVIEGVEKELHFCKRDTLYFLGEL